MIDSFVQECPYCKAVAAIAEELRKAAVGAEGNQISVRAYRAGDTGQQEAPAVHPNSIAVNCPWCMNTRRILTSEGRQLFEAFKVAKQREQDATVNKDIPF